jgi:Ca-activated chloride channel family protein
VLVTLAVLICGFVATGGPLGGPLGPSVAHADGGDIASYAPYGETPIGYALQQAGDDLGATGKRSIVLVSDGEPTGQPDPCEVARKLVQGDIDLRIDVVGLDVGARARHSLQCIAEKGHGTYYDVTGSEDVAQSLQKVATRAARPFTTIGRPVSGADTSAGAPTITNGD